MTIASPAIQLVAVMYVRMQVHDSDQSTYVGNTNQPHLAVRLQKSISTAIQFVMPPTRPNMPMARTTRTTQHTVTVGEGSWSCKVGSKDDEAAEQQHRTVYNTRGATRTGYCNSKSNTEIVCSYSTKSYNCRLKEGPFYMCTVVTSVSCCCGTQ